MTFAERLRYLRGNQTQVSFARRLGISQGTYNRYEAGSRKSPSLHMVTKISKALNVPVGWLLGIENNDHPVTTSKNANAEISNDYPTSVSDDTRMLAVSFEKLTHSIDALTHVINRIGARKTSKP